MDDMTDTEKLETVKRLTRDIAQASITLSDDEARFLVDAYYIMQKDRIRSNAQMKALSENEEPHLLLTWFGEQTQVLENQIKNALNRYSLNHPVGEWMQGLFGVGPVISAGMLAHIDITRCPTAGHIWSYAGWNPKMVWGEGQKRPFNAEFKVLCYKAGESFVKFHTDERCYYGHIYASRKEWESRNNISKKYADQAEKALKTKKIRKETDAYKYYIVGMLPPAHIHARARRYAAKIFLSHVHYKLYVHHYKEEPPKPFAFGILAHDEKHYIPPF